jgi:hypothetical protein
MPIERSAECGAPWAVLQKTKQTTGVKDVGVLIAQMVWEDREETLVKTIEKTDGKEPKTKQIKSETEQN